MSTLKELFDKYGSVWLADRFTPQEKYFRPLAYSEVDNTLIVGEVISYFGRATDFRKDYNKFVIYKEPKKEETKGKVKRYQYAVKRVGLSLHEIIPVFYKDDEQFKKSFQDPYYNYKRLDYTETEFEE